MLDEFPRLDGTLPSYAASASFSPGSKDLSSFVLH
jgi:hypothetical protein